MIFLNPKRFKLSRRAMLRGTGVALALPLLEAMLDRKAFAQAILPKRVVFGFSGGQLHGDGKPSPGGLAGMADPTGHTIAADVGPNYTMPFGWQPLAPIRDLTTIVSGLSIPGTGPGAAGAVETHELAGPITFSGKKRNEVGPTVDQLLIPTLASPTQLFPSIQLHTHQREANYPLFRKLNAAGTGNQYLLGFTSPTALFNSLFQNLTIGATPAELAYRDLVRERNLSILDRLGAQTAALASRLGKADRQRVTQHLETVRDLERRLQMTTVPVTPSCTLPAVPVPPPTMPPTTADTAAIQKKYAEDMMDLVHLALVCDLTRVVGWIFADLTGNFFFPSGHSVNGTEKYLSSHGVSHDPSPFEPEARVAARWLAVMLGHFARFVQKLKDTPEGAGTLLDNTLVTQMFEFGFGAGVRGGTNFIGHSNTNMQIYYATGMPELKKGEHIAATDRHPGEVMFTLMRALGSPLTALGEHTAEVSELRT